MLGKCGESHETQSCKNTTIKCCQCKGSHKAWHYKCPIKLMKRKIKHQLPHKFIVPKHTPQENESEGEEEESSSNLDDNKSPFSWPPSFNYIPSSSSSFGKYNAKRRTPGLWQISATLWYILILE